MCFLQLDPGVTELLSSYNPSVSRPVYGTKIQTIFTFSIFICMYPASSFMRQKSELNLHFQLFICIYTASSFYYEFLSGLLNSRYLPSTLIMATDPVAV